MTGFFYSLTYGLLLSTAGIFSPFSPKLRRGLLGRIGLEKRVRHATSDWKSGSYWFHVASSGELEQCLPILNQVKKLTPERKILLTFFSPTAKKAIELERERREQRGATVPWDYADYSPFDFPWMAGRILDFIRPEALVLIHRELWPGLILACHSHHVPCYLFATYVPPSSAKWAKRHRRWLKYFEAVGTTEKTTAQGISEILPKIRVGTQGDPRIERVLLRKEKGKELAELSRLKTRPNLILASLWPQDFVELEASLTRLLSTQPGWRQILVPHEPTEKEVTLWMDWFHSRGVPAKRWSEWLPLADNESHLVVDRVGILAELYGAGDMVFVGGSFRSRVHNVLEPAAYGLPILTGPRIENSGEAMEMSALQMGLVRVKDGAEFFAEASKMIEDASLRQSTAKRSQLYLQERQGASDRYAHLLLDRGKA